MTSVIHLFNEGFSYGMPPWFDGDQRWPGVLGSDRYKPADWANPDKLTSIYDHIRSVIVNPNCYLQLIEHPENDAISRCEEISNWCREAQLILSKCPATKSPESQSELRALIASAHIAEEAALEHGNVLRARVAWEAVKHIDFDNESSEKARKSAIYYYEKAVNNLSRQIPWGLELARIYPDVINHITESHETFNRLTMATRLRIRKEELHRIKTINGPDWAKQMIINFWDHLPHTIGSHAKGELT